VSVDIVTFRGFIEKIIDSQLETENLAQLHILFEGLKPAVTHRESAIFGNIVGYLISSAWQVINTFEKRGLRSEEVHEVTTILMRRGLEIKHRIMATST